MDKEVFKSGAQRDTNKNKPRPDLIPGCCSMRVGEHFRLGAEKYGEHNYKKGIPSSRSLASLCRHLEKLKMGYNDEDHLAAIVVNAYFIMFNEWKYEGNKELLDLPHQGAST